VLQVCKLRYAFLLITVYFYSSPTFIICLSHWKGIVGAGGNVGAVSYGMAFRQLDSKKALTITGITVLISSILPLFMVIEGEDSVLFRRNRSQQKNRNVDEESQ
jgi:hypothetical protein